MNNLINIDNCGDCLNEFQPCEACTIRETTKEELKHIKKYFWFYEPDEYSEQW